MGKLERRLIKFKKTHPYNVFNNRMRSLKRRWIYVNWYGIFFWRLLNEISMWSYEIRITCYDLLSNYTKGYRHAYIVYILHIVVVQSLSHVPLFATPWTPVCQASLSFTISRSLLKLMSMELVMPSQHLIVHWPLLILPSIFPNTRVFSNESTLCDPMDCSMPGSSILHYLQEFAQTHVHWVGDTNQPSHPALNLSQHQGLFQWVGSSHQMAKVLELQLQHQSFQWKSRVDFL